MASLHRLKGQANICQFSIKCKDCDKDVSYSEQIVRDSLIRGIYDEDIRLEVLSDTTLATKTLNGVIDLIEAKEGSRRTMSRLSFGGEPTSTSSSAVSNYRRQNNKHRTPAKPRGAGFNPTTGSQSANPEACGYCGQSHARPSSRKERMKLCPAFNHVCTNCNTPRHHERVCRRRAQDNGANATAVDDATAVFQELCSVDSSTYPPILACPPSPQQPTFASVLEV